MSFTEKEQKAIAAWERLAKVNKTIPSKNAASTAAGLSSGYITNNKNKEFHAYFRRRTAELIQQGYSDRKPGRGEQVGRSLGKKRANIHTDRDLNLRDRILTALRYRGPSLIGEISQMSGGTDRDLEAMLRKLTDEGAIEMVGRWPTKYDLTAYARRTTA